LKNILLVACIVLLLHPALKKAQIIEEKKLTAKEIEYNLNSRSKLVIFAAALKKVTFIDTKKVKIEKKIIVEFA
jgi:hypothetical protein